MSVEDKSKKTETKIQYNHQELSAFCLQVSLLLDAAIPLEEGLSVMWEDTSRPQEQAMLKQMAEDVELGDPFYRALERSGCFPPYVVRMAKLGQQTGTMEQMMRSLSRYYTKENQLLAEVRSALTYPIIMIFMLLAVLFVLFTKVMPVFEGVYEQLGARISPIAQSAVHIGSVFSKAAILVILLLGAVVGFLYAASRFGKRFAVVDKMIDAIKRRNSIALAIAGRRFTSVLALCLNSGMELEKGFELAEELVDNSMVREKIKASASRLEAGDSYYQAMKVTGLFSSFHIQMIKVGARSGRLDQVLEEISDNYERQAEGSINRMIARFEPTMVAVLAVAVGLILLSVMLPLVGVLSSIG